MKRCKQCRWWIVEDEDRYNGILQPIDPDTYRPMTGLPFEVRECRNPKQTFCERPVISDGFALADGSEYMATLYTAEDFGCVLWEDGVDPE